MKQLSTSITWAVFALTMAVPPAAAQTAPAAPQIYFGDDSGSVAKDGLCNDGRFTGVGMGPTEDAIEADASDCRKAVELGVVALRSPELALRSIPDGLDFGDDEGMFANDGACDDPQFVGNEDGDPDEAAHDATDCKAAWQAGKLELAVSDQYYI